MLKSILNNTCELVQLLNAWAIPKSAIPLQILKISKQMLILLKKFIIIFTLMLLVYEIRKSNAVIEGQSNVFFLYLVGQFREKNKRVELILTKKKKRKLKFTLIDLKLKVYHMHKSVFSFAYLTLTFMNLSWPIVIHNQRNKQMVFETFVFDKHI